MNILVLMAGNGSRFIGSKYKESKPFIPVNGRPMFLLAIDSLGLSGNLISVSKLPVAIPGMISLTIEDTLDGAAKSALVAKDYIDNDEELIIMNSDQIIDWDSSLINDARSYDGALLLFEAEGDRWSFAEVSDGLIVRVAEKIQISTHALSGIHYWKRGSDFVKYAEQMIQANEMINGEFYIAPVYNYAINDNKKIFPIFINKMYDLGTPEALDSYLSDII